MLSLRTSVILLSVALALSPAAAITVTQFNLPLTENFNTLATVTGSAMPPGWEFSESGSGANTTYGAGTGSSSTGNTYSFGGASSADRAIGGVRTSSVASSWGTVITNQTGAVITQLDLQYLGEQWRLGATGRADRLDFSFSLDATSLNTGSWIDFDALDFTGLVTAGTTGALDGNDAPNSLLVSGTLSGLSLAPGASLWLRWSDFDATGSDDGLAVDDFSITAVQGGIQSVPDDLPLVVVTAAMGALLVAGARFGRFAA